MKSIISVQSRFTSSRKDLRCCFPFAFSGVVDDMDCLTMVTKVHRVMITYVKMLNRRGQMTFTVFGTSL